MKNMLIFLALLVALLPLGAVYHKIGGYATPLDAQAVVVQNGIAYLEEGITNQLNYSILQTLDISDPSNLLPLGSLNIPLGAYASYSGIDLGVENGIAYIALNDAPYSLKIVDVSDPLNPTYLSNIWANSMDVCVVDSLAYVAADAYGLRIYDISDPLDIVLLGSLDTPGNVKEVTFFHLPLPPASDPGSSGSDSGGEGLSFF